MGYYTIFKGKAGEYRFNLKADNHQIILASEGYTQLHNCEGGIYSVQSNGRDRDNFEIRLNKNSEPYFVLKADNGEIIGTSESYSSMQMCHKGISSVMSNALTSDIRRAPELEKYTGEDLYEDYTVASIDKLLIAVAALILLGIAGTLVYGLVQFILTLV